jgi:catalase
MGPRIGPCSTAAGDTLDADVSVENEPGVLFDGLIVPDGEDRMAQFLKDARTLDYLKDMYRHCKALLVFGDAGVLLETAGIPRTLPDGSPDPGLVLADDAEAIRDFIEVAGRRHWERETDPPRV